MAVSSAAVFNICPVITNHSYVRASSSALKLVEGCGGLSGATKLRGKKHRTAAECLLK